MQLFFYGGYIFDIMNLKMTKYFCVTNNIHFSSLAW